MTHEALRALIADAIAQEIFDQQVVAGTFDAGALADAVLAVLPPAIPAADLVERLSAVAAKLEGAMPVTVEHPSELVLVWPAHMPVLSEETIKRARETLAAWKPGDGPLLIEGFEVRGKIEPPASGALGGGIITDKISRYRWIKGIPTD